MSFAAPVAFAVVVAWLIITLVAQVTLIRRMIAPADLFAVIPSWTFFAPSPGIRDYHLVWREIDQEGSASWVNVPLSLPRPKYAFVWHPQKRTKKILSDAAQALHSLKQHQGFSDDQLQMTIPYLLLLRYSQLKSDKPRVAQGQFAVIASWGHDDPSLEVSFVSGVHGLS